MMKLARLNLKYRIAKLSLLSILAFITLATIALPPVIRAQTVPVDREGSPVGVPAQFAIPEKFDRVVEEARDRQLNTLAFPELIQAIAEQFIGTPYVPGLLDRNSTETLVISLDGFDCVLFVETVLAIARGVALQDYSYPTFTRNLERQRYRDGLLDDYCSRLHYFSDWIFDNQNRYLVKNITPSLGGLPLPKTLNFMSKNRASYPQLSRDTNYQCILDVENHLKQQAIAYIPQDRIHQVYDRLQPGDIIATATDIDGLDVTHTGLVYRFEDGAIGFIHASPAGRVTISRDLQAYVRSVDGQIGIIVARPLDPRLGF
jgi:hypothetical protein